MKNWIKGLLVASTILGTPIAITQAEPVAIYAEEQQNSHVLIWGALVQAGYSEQATAGILANIEAESLGDQTYIQGGRNWEQFIKGATGIGIGQWTNATKQDEFFAFAEEKGVDWTDLNMQIEFLLQDLEKEEWLDARYKDFEDFKTTDDLDKATKMVMQGYFKPTDQSQLVINERLNFAKEFMKEFGTPEPVVEDKKVAETPVPAKDEQVAPKVQEEAKPVTVKPDTEPVVAKEISPITQQISEGIEKTVQTSTENTKPYSNVPITQGVIQGESRVYPIMPMTICAILTGFIFGFALLYRQGYLDKAEDCLLVYQYRRSLIKKYKK